MQTSVSRQARLCVFKYSGYLSSSKRGSHALPPGHLLYANNEWSWILRRDKLAEPCACRTRLGLDLAFYISLWPPRRCTRPPSKQAWIRLSQTCVPHAVACCGLVPELGPKKCWRICLSGMTPVSGSSISLEYVTYSSTWQAKNSWRACPPWLSTGFRL